MHSKSEFGRKGERLAAKFLISRGYKILGRGVHAGRLGELDLVARRGRVLVFVEVKTRRSDLYGTPEESISSYKQQRLQRAIDWYRREKGLMSVPYQLDVIAIEYSGQVPIIRHHVGVGID